MGLAGADNLIFRFVVTAPSAVHVLDDDESVRSALERQLRAHGWVVKTYATIAEFEHSDADAAPGCLLLDLRITDGSGLDLLARLEHSHTHLGVVLLTGYGDVRSTVRAMRLGASDFLMKPITAGRLMEAVRRATAKSQELWTQHIEIADLEARLARLTPRELEVGTLVASGLLNKHIATELGVSEKTVKAHRGRVMAKLEVTSVAHLVRMLDRLSAHRG